jgi:hypothetical protein
VLSTPYQTDDRSSIENHTLHLTSVYVQNELPIICSKNMKLESTMRLTPVFRKLLVCVELEIYNILRKVEQDFRSMKHIPTRGGTRILVSQETNHVYKQKLDHEE